MLKHKPVLLEEVVVNVLTDKSGVYLDATFGRGGHSSMILEKLESNGKLIVIDKDLEAIKYAEEYFGNNSKVLHIYHGCFSKINEFLASIRQSENLTGVVMDLGISSPQLDDAQRGFSFKQNVKLDMRMDQTKNLSAVDWLNVSSEIEIADSLYYYADEVFSRKIAANIVKQRRIKKIEMVFDLLEIIKQSVPAKYWQQKGKHPATKTFMAIRIAVNNEFEILETGLNQAFSNLKKKGRLVIISFHSIEDRIVKKVY